MAKTYRDYVTQEQITNSVLASVPKNIEEYRVLSHIRYKTEDTPYNYIECEICKSRFGQISKNHFVKYHPEITYDEYMKKYNVKTSKCQAQCDRVKGENNPGFSHGGKLSKYSKNFIKYDGQTDEEISLQIKEINDKKNQTIKDNPQNQLTRIEYYLAKGMSEEDAKIALSERQSTFSLAICKEKYGEVEGSKIWQARQDKWKQSLSNKSQDELGQIDRKKSNHKTYIYNDSVETTRLYFINIKDEFYKIGVTAYDVDSRYSQNNYQSVLIQSDMIDVTNAMMVEKIVKMAMTPYGITKSEEIYPFGWTETLKIPKDKINAIVGMINTLLNKEYEELDVLFEKYVRAKSV